MSVDYPSFYHSQSSARSAISSRTDPISIIDSDSPISMADHFRTRNTAGVASAVTGNSHHSNPSTSSISSFAINSSPIKSPSSNQVSTQSNGLAGKTYERGKSKELAHEKFLVPDRSCIDFLAKDKSVNVDSKFLKITGYEVYIVEQWACARRLVTAIVSYTGNPEHVVAVAEVRVPKRPELRSQKVQHFYEQLANIRTRPKDCDKLGQLFVTNLSSFPSNLTLIAVPDGDVAGHRGDFILNEDLRRLGCGGRSGITLNKPTDASIDKFQQIFRISDRIPITTAIIGLVGYVQIALCYFGLFNIRNIDGLLCDHTERALYEWWQQVGILHYNFDPPDTGLNPTTVAALLGMVVGCRHRLNSTGAPIPKDPFDVDAFMAAIRHFQKQNKMASLSSVLDETTLNKLLRLTGRISASERFTLTKVVKTTVQDLSGIHSQSAIDVETTDYDRFLENIYGDSLRYLWGDKVSVKNASAFSYIWRARSVNKKSDSSYAHNPSHHHHFHSYFSPEVEKMNPFSTNFHTSNHYQHHHAPYPSDGGFAQESPIKQKTILSSDEIHDNNKHGPLVSERYQGETDENLVDADVDDTFSQGLLPPSALDSQHSSRPKLERADSDILLSRSNLRKAIRLGKVKPDAAFRSGVNRLTGNLRQRRRRQEDEYSSTLKPKSRASNISDNDGSTQPSRAASVVTDESGKKDDEIENEVNLSSRASDIAVGDDDSEDAQAVGGDSVPTIYDQYGEPIDDINTDLQEAAEKFVERVHALEEELVCYEQRSDDSRTLMRFSRSCSNLSELVDHHCIAGGLGIFTKLNTSTDEEDKPVRRMSFSLVDSHFFTWEEPFDHSIVSLVRRLDRIKKLQEWSKSQIGTQGLSGFVNDYDDHVNDLGDLMSRATAKFSEIQQEVEYLDQQDSYLANRVHELDTLASRVQYEVRTLDKKLNDLDESIDSFGVVIESMDKRIRTFHGRYNNNISVAANVSISSSNNEGNNDVDDANSTNDEDNDSRKYQ
ncbi:hypothetical protein V1511DRAFT_261076 [Dipodascopsis uninucleata]